MVSSMLPFKDQGAPNKSSRSRNLPRNPPRNPYARGLVQKKPVAAAPKFQAVAPRFQARAAAVAYTRPQIPLQLAGYIRYDVPYQAPGPQIHARVHKRSNPYELPTRESVPKIEYTRQAVWYDTKTQREKSSSKSYGGFNRREPEVTEQVAEQTPEEQEFKCDVCDVTCKSQHIYDQHMKGKGHQKKVKRMEVEELWERRDPSAYCSVCDLALEPSMMEMHLEGAKHRSMLENPTCVQVTDDEESADFSTSAHNSLVVDMPCDLCSMTLKTLKDVRRHFNSKTHMKKCVEKFNEDKRTLEENPFYCKVCDIALNGQKTFDAHIQGFKHNHKLKSAENLSKEMAADQEFFPEVDDYTTAFPDEFITDTGGQPEVYTSAFAVTTPAPRCELCDISFNGLKPYEAHIQGYKHNYRLTNGVFDSDSPFCAKSTKMKEKKKKKRIEMDELSIPEAFEEY